MREQILLMDPLPDVYKAYCLMLLVEKPMNPQQFPVENVAAVRPKNNRFWWRSFAAYAGKISASISHSHMNIWMLQAHLHWYASIHRVFFVLVFKYNHMCILYFSVLERMSGGGKLYVSSCWDLQDSLMPKVGACSFFQTFAAYFLYSESTISSVLMFELYFPLTDSWLDMLLLGSSMHALFFSLGWMNWVWVGTLDLGFFKTRIRLLASTILFINFHKQLVTIFINVIDHM